MLMPAPSRLLGAAAQDVQFKHKGRVNNMSKREDDLAIYLGASYPYEQKVVVAPGM